jgi:acyl carrier protein
MSIAVKSIVDVSGSKVADITPETNLADIKMDSLSAIEVLMKIESELKSITGNKNLSLPDNLLSEAKTVNDLAEGIKKHVYGGA